MLLLSGTAHVQAQQLFRFAVGRPVILVCHEALIASGFAADLLWKSGNMGIGHKKTR
ncbi:MAG: hypothetical protein ABIR56_00495 [Polaromonas sp.]